MSDKATNHILYCKPGHVPYNFNIAIDEHDNTLTIIYGSSILTGTKI